EWRSGDVVELRLAMAARRIECHPFVADNAGRVALARGPLVYCLEGVDHPGIDLRGLWLPDGSELRPAFEPECLGGLVVLSAEARIASLQDWNGRLYRTHLWEHGERGPKSGPGSAVSLRAVPYYAWANRAPGAMQVWIRTTPAGGQ